MLDLILFILPDFMQCFMRYSILSFKLLHRNCVKTWKILRRAYSIYPERLRSLSSAHPLPISFHGSPPRYTLM